MIELIAEMRWIPQGSTAVGPDIPQQATLPKIFLGGTKQEEFYMRVGGALYKHGFDRSERLTPAGMPFVLHQPVYRFRSETEEKRSVIFQVGYGIFSVHGIPPYHSWAGFSPFVHAGIGELLESRTEADANQPFTQLSLRYIDFFGEEMTQGRNTPSFMSEVFGMSTMLPAALTQVVTSNEVKSLFTKIVLPIEIGDLTVNAGDGVFNNKSGIVLDTMASSSTETAPKLDAIMKTFESAHTVIHKMFFDLTRPLYELMQPQGANGK
ncbi:MAG: TIGR04255 family protein [Acidobacteria bacterium]|nr:TIGR04255 family protein [Acidobacteriota bacterium]MCL5286471.1 TIGR04255 family protein [Acidobacteriota bacterium]